MDQAARVQHTWTGSGNKMGEAPGLDLFSSKVCRSKADLHGQPSSNRRVALPAIDRTGLARGRGRRRDQHEGGRGAREGGRGRG